MDYYTWELEFKNIIFTVCLLISYILFARYGGEEPHEENRVHLGNAIMSFYAALIDLLGRCAPEMHVSERRPFPFYPSLYIF